MRTNRTRNRNLVLIAFVVLGLTTLAVAVNAGWTNENLKAWGGTGPAPDKSSDHIFSDGFETGDLSGWADTAPAHCPVPNLSLPTPAKR